MLHRSPGYTTRIYPISILQSSFRTNHLASSSHAASHPHLGHVYLPSNLRYFGSKKVKRRFEPSPAQLAIVDACRTQNVIVSARPGSGKTATAEAIVRANPSKRIAIITYSKRLKLDTENKLQKHRHHTKVLTFHGLACKLFDTTVSEDAILNRLRKDKIAPCWNPRYDIVILDEMQDLKDNLYWLLRVFLSTLNRTMKKKKNKNRKPRLIVLGDPRQTIFQHQNADSRYLERVEDILQDITPYSWKKMQLDKSFRLSHQTAAFINGFVKERYIEGSHDGEIPIYLHANVWDNKTLLDLILPLIRKYKPENTVILSPTVQRSRSISGLTNALSELHIPIAQPSSDDIALDDDVLRGKLTVSSYHQFKGCERDLAIVYGVDDSYFTHFGRNLHDDSCPNATFVALTRARKQLIVIQQTANPAMPFMSWEEMTKTAQYMNLAKWDPKQQKLPGRPIKLELRLPKNLMVTEICSKIDQEKLQALVQKYIRIQQIPPAEDFCIDAPSKVLTDSRRHHYEQVGDLNGLAVTAAFEWDRTKACTTFGYTGEQLSGKTLGVRAIPKDREGCARWFAKQALIYDSSRGDYQSRRIQMENHPFDWLDDHLYVTTQRLSKQFLDSPNLKFEVLLSQTFRVDGETQESGQEVCIHGRADIVAWKGGLRTPPTIWEIKFTSSLRFEHIAQVAIYGYLWFMEQSNRESAVFPSLALFNIQDGVKWEIESTPEDMSKFIEGVLRVQYTTSGEKDLSTFREECQKTNEEVDLLMETWKEQKSALKGKERFARKSSTGFQVKPSRSKEKNKRPRNKTRPATNPPKISIEHPLLKVLDSLQNAI